MFKKSKVSAGVLVALGGALALPAAPAFSQATERIEVTGSRLRSLNAESPSPVQVLSAEEIATSGAVNLQDLLLKNPTLGTPAISRTNSNFATSSAGVAVVDLRNLGTARTLVLVNGRRFVSGVPGDQSVDLNTIPTDFIERVEILTGGASALYGSDAVAGVVNIILKKNFTGISVDASKGQSKKNDDKRDEFSLSLGSNSADGKASIMAHLGYSKQGAVFSNKRAPTDDITQASINALFFDQPATAADIGTYVSPFFSSFAPQGRIFYTINNPNFDPSQPVGPDNPLTIARNRTFDRNGNPIPNSTNGPRGDGVGATGFNRQDFRTIALPIERYLFATKAEAEYLPGHTVFLEGNYAQSQSRTRLEPFPLDSADGQGGIYPATGVGPAEFRVGNQILPNPFIPASILAEMVDSNGDGLRDYSFSRRLAEVGNRGNTADRDTFRVVTGLRGSFGGWDYDVFAGYGATKESQVSSGQVNVLNFRNALEATADVNDVDGDGDTTEAVCLDEQARAQGCVPIDVFGFNSISPAALKYVTAPSLLSTFTSQKLAGAQIRGEPFSLPAGPFGVAAGFEVRKEFSRSEFDPLQQSGLNGGNAIPRTEGAFDVTDAFAEVRVPLLKNAPFAKLVQLSGAVRVGDYSTVGSTTSWTAAFEWTPLSDVRLRATQARATRAPNINELFSPPSQTFPSVTDPCVGVTATSVGTISTRCRADSGVAANIAANGGVFTLNQADIQGTSGFDRGNPNLTEEKGDSTTLGIVFTPTSIPWLRNFTFTADYFRIEIADAIVNTPRDFILQQCYSGDASFCQFITRRPTAVGSNSAGSLALVDSAVTNSGGLYTEGADFTVGYADKVGPGRMNAQLAYTRTKAGYLIPLRGSEADHFAGEVGAPRDKATLRLGYNIGAFGISTTTTYIHRSALDDQQLKSFGLKQGEVTVPSKTYFDFQVGYTYQKATFYFGMDNAFDTKAPRFDTNGLITYGTTGAGTAADVYDAIGQRYYAGVRFQF